MDFRRIKFLLLKFKLMHFNLLSIFLLTFVFFGFVITFSFINQYFDEINLDDSKIADIIDRDNNNKNALADSFNKNMSLSSNTLWSSSLIIEKVDEQNNPIGGATFL